MSDAFAGTILAEDAIESAIRSANAVRLTPKGRSWWLRLRLLSALSHHDPAQADKSNRLLFRRQAQVAHEAPGGRKPTQEEIDAICERLPVPTDTAPLFAEATLEQFIAAALV